MAYFGKEFKFEREENCDALLEALDRAAPDSTNVLRLKANQSVLKNGDDYTLIINLPNAKKEIKFKNGATVEDTFNSAGLVAQSTFTVDGDVFTQMMDFGPKGTLTIKREYTADSLKLSITSSRWDGVGVRYYVPA